jgi:hypothetical protein
LPAIVATPQTGGRAAIDASGTTGIDRDAQRRLPGEHDIRHKRAWRASRDHHASVNDNQKRRLHVHSPFVSA